MNSQPTLEERKLTLQALCADELADDATRRAYHAARRAKEDEIAEWIVDYLRPDVAAGVLASRLFEASESSGEIDGDSVSGEIPGRFTRDGRSLIFKI